MPKKKKIPSYNELIDKIMAICPNAEFGEDSDGQITIETGYAMAGSDEDEPLEPISEIDEDAGLSDEDEDEDEDEDSEDEDDDD